MANARSDDGATARRLAKQLWEARSTHRRRLEELLPGLSEVPGPEPPLRVGVRAHNVLMRSNLRSWKQVAQATTGDFRSLPNFGVRSFTEVFEASLNAWADLAQEDVRRSADHDISLSRPSDRASLTGASAAEAFWPRVERFLRCMWFESGAATVGEALALWDGKDENLRALAHELSLAPLTALIDVREADENAWTVLLDFSGREEHILRRRVLAPRERATLEELGQALGVSRQRINQLETRVRKELKARLQDRAAPLEHEIARLRRRIGNVAHETSLHRVVDETVAATSDPPPTDSMLRRQLLLWACGPFVEVGGLQWSPAGLDQLRVTEARINEIRPGDLVPEELEDEFLSALDAPGDVHESLREHLQIRRVNGVLIRWGGSLGDKAAGVLRAFESPMTILELHEQVGVERNPRSLAMSLQADRRIMRRGKDTYGLREYGGEEYSGILEELEQAIERAGGTVHLPSIVDEFVSAFGVAPGSVRLYATDRRFVRHGDDLLSLRTDDHNEESVDLPPVETAAGAFLLDSVWHLRIEVTEDVLRGSGRPLRRAIAGEVGLEPELTFGYAYEGGSVTFSWRGVQPSIGSVRSIAIAHACRDGDLIFLPLSGSEPRTSRVVRLVDREREVGIGRVALEMGLDPSRVAWDDALAAATALGLPAGAYWEDIADRLQGRGDAEVLSHLPPDLR